MPLRTPVEVEPSFRGSDHARGLARRCEPQVDAFVQRMTAQWAVHLPEYPTLRGADVAEAARWAVLSFLRRVQGVPAAAQDARALFRRRAAHRAEEGMPLPILLRTYTIAARVLFEEFCRAARPEESAALPELAGLLLVSQDEAIDEVARAYQEELTLLGSARRDRRRELVRDLIAAVAPLDRAALGAFGLADGAAVLALRLGAADEASDAVSRSGIDSAQDAAATEAAMDRRLHRLHEAIDEYFGGPVPALLEGTGGHVLIPMALVRPGGGGAGGATAAAIAAASSLPAEFAHGLARVWGGEVRVAVAVAQQPDRIGPAARTAGEILRLVCVLGRPTGVYSLEDVLLEYHLTRDNESAARLGALLDPLTDRPDLLRTVRVFLEEEYDRRRTAKRLGLHPNTVDNRLARVTELTGLNPATPRGVALLMTTLALRDLG